ncbi:hypothetical protein DBR40_12300 [Pedobacter sp. KBW01]|nr:hypothetical protein DBR40_12300 [Pedobacter sp. KBW01]
MFVAETFKNNDLKRDFAFWPVFYTSYNALHLPCYFFARLLHYLLYLSNGFRKIIVIVLIFKFY